MARLEGDGGATLSRDAAGKHRGICRLIAPLPDIYMRLIESRVLGIRGHEQGATFVGLRVGHHHHPSSRQPPLVAANARQFASGQPAPKSGGKVVGHWPSE